MKIDQAVFKAYDIRGIYPTEINGELAYKIGQAFATFTKDKIVVGRDMRKSSKELFDNISAGINSMGYEVVDIGVCTTPMLNFAVASQSFKGGVMITASHNPSEYNGIKLIGEKAVQYTLDNGVDKIKDLVLTNVFSYAKNKGLITSENILPKYINWIISKVPGIKKFKIVADAGNGVGGISALPVLQKLDQEIVPMYFELDDSFPNHLADPMDPKNLEDLKKKVKDSKSDLGVGFDGDADRAGLVDENGQIVKPDFLLSAIAECELKNHPNQKIYYDLRFSRSVPETIKKAGGIPIRTKVGNPNFKRPLILEGGIMGVEFSCHFMYRENFGIDDGLFALLKVLYWLSKNNCSLSEFISKYQKNHFLFSTNFQVSNVETAIFKLKEHFNDGKFDYLDGITIEYPDWWFVARPSNTEPVLRLNIEASSKDLLEQKKNELINLLK